MAEGGIDDVGVGDTGQEFVGADARDSACLRNQPGVGGAIQFEQRLEVGHVGRQPGEDALVAVAGGHQAMRVADAHLVRAR